MKYIQISCEAIWGFKNSYSIQIQRANGQHLLAFIDEIDLRVTVYHARGERLSLFTVPTPSSHITLSEYISTE